MSDQDPTTRLNAALEGRYRIGSELGEGGMATVYLADDLKHERKVALKVLKPELAAVVGAERFLAEIKTTANLQHPHILPLFDSGEADSFLFYAMPYVEGESLRERLDREHQLPVHEAVGITTNVAEALHYAHSQGVIHRDIKPANILLQAGKPVIADFGIALAVDTAGQGRLTETGLSLGTPHYMSPEQATGDQYVGAATDIYALGCVLYEMLIGEPPFTGGTPQAILGKIIAGEAGSVIEQRKTVPANVSAAVASALEKVPADRLSSAAHFAEALKNASFVGTATAASRKGQSTDLMSVGSWKRRAIAAAVLAVLSSVAAIWGWSRPIETAASTTRQAIALGSTRNAPDPAIARNIAISPDGHALLFSDTVGGVDQLWIKHEDRLDAEPLGGTAGAIAPFFSPDGEWIGFFTDAGLRKVPIGGGAPMTLAERPVRDITLERRAVWGAGAWADDGTIAFLGFDGAKIHVTSESTPGYEILVPITGGFGSSPRSISALPHGRGFLYGACQGGECSDGVWVFDPDVGEPRQLIGGASRAWYVPTGHIMYTTQEGSAFTQPFDLATLTVSGSPTPLMDGIRVARRDDWSGVILPEITVSRSGTAVYMAGSVGSVLPQVVWVSRSGESTPVDPNWVLDRASVAGLALSPNGERLAITIGGSGGGDEIGIKELDDGPLTRITSGFSWSYRPEWSTDGSTLTFVSSGDRGINVPNRLYEVRLDGTGEAVEIAQSEQTIEEGFRSPDGEWLVIRVGGVPGDLDRDLYAIARGDSALVPIAVVEGSQQRDPALSPNGRWLAYRSDHSGRTEFYVRPFPGSNETGEQVSRGALSSQTFWSRDGRELFYVGPEGLVALQVSAEDEFAILGRQVLFPTRGRFTVGYDISPDGSRFIMIELSSESGTASGLVMVKNLFVGLDSRVGSGR